MSRTSPRRRDKETLVQPKQRSGRQPASESTSSPPSGFLRSFAKAIFSGKAAWVSLALVATTVIVYASVWHHGFVSYDDPAYVTANPQVSGGLTWRGVAWAFTTGHAANWHPLTWLSHMLDVQLYGMRAGPHHLMNLLLHIANALLLFGLLHGMTGALGRSAFVAGLFAVHPLHVESVAWVAERKDVLSTSFGMLTIWAYVAYVRQPRLRRYLTVVLLFALGLMAKPMLVTLPFVLLLLDVWPLRRVAIGADSSDRAWWLLSRERRSVALRLVREKLPLFALTVASSIVTFVVQQQGGTVSAIRTLPLDLRVENALVSYVAYIGKMLWPARLAAFYPYPESFPEWWVVGSALGLIAVSVLVIRAARRHPYLPVGWLWYLGTLVPVIGLAQAGDQSMADRYTYLPLIGLFLLVSWGIPDLFVRWRSQRLALSAAAGIVILACAITARGQVRHWENNIALWEHALGVTRENYLGHHNLAVSLNEQGRVNEAIAHYAEVLRIAPNFAQSHLNLGITLAGQGRLSEAIPHLSEALLLQPDSADAHSNLGAALAREGKVGEAIPHFAAAVRSKPDSVEAHHNLGSALAIQGRVEEAIHEFSEALRINPSYPASRLALDQLKNQGKNPAPGTP